jgi:hypothetical protein
MIDTFPLIALSFGQLWKEKKIDASGLERAYRQYD